MEIFVNQGRDSTIEPAYLAEKKQAISEPNLTTLNVTPTSEAQTITPESPVDGYSQVNVAAAPSANLMGKTIVVPLPGIDEMYSASTDEVDGYSVINLTGPSQQEIATNWCPVELHIDATTHEVTIGTSEADLTAAYQAGKNFYIQNVTVMPEIQSNTNN